MNTPQPHEVYTAITNHVITQLENNIIPWRKLWTDAGHPQNLFTKRLYTGINAWLLGSLGYSQNYFLTWKQLQSVGGKVRKGERPHMIIYWQQESPLYKAYSTESYKSTITPVSYHVYNIAQCDYLPEILEIPFPSGPTFKLAACVRVAEQMPNCPTIKHGKQQVFYDPLKDRITIPKRESFATIESYYCSLYQHLVYSTAHRSRLNRSTAPDNDERETLIAEIGTGYLNSIVGNRDTQFINGVGSCGEWIERFKRNNGLIIEASTHAQRATNYILDMWSIRADSVVPILHEMETQ